MMTKLLGHNGTYCSSQVAWVQLSMLDSVPSPVKWTKDLRITRDYCIVGKFLERPASEKRRGRTCIRECSQDQLCEEVRAAGLGKGEIEL